MSEDESHLNSLAIAHYVVGGVMAFFACMPLFHFGIGVALLMGMDIGEVQMEGDWNGEPVSPRFFGFFFAAIGLAFFLFGQAVSVCVILSGRFLKRRKNYMFSFVFACIACAFFPFGTVLGVFTIVVLSRDSVKALYGRI